MSPPAGVEGMTQPNAPAGERFETVRIWLLGGFRVSVGSRTIEHDQWRLRNSAALVKLLALAPSHRLHREQVIDLLWPDSGRRTASNSLRQALFAARKALDPAAGSRYLASEDEQLTLCPGRDLWVDVEAFEEAASTVRGSRATGVLTAGTLAGDRTGQDGTTVGVRPLVLRAVRRAEGIPDRT